MDHLKHRQEDFPIDVPIFYMNTGYQGTKHQHVSFFQITKSEKGERVQRLDRLFFSMTDILPMVKKHQCKNWWSLCIDNNTYRGEGIVKTLGKELYGDALAITSYEMI